MGKRRHEEECESIASQIDSYCNRSGGIEVLTSIARKLNAASEDKNIDFDEITLHHATRLLTVYKASLSREDQLILFILRALHDVCGMDFNRLSPVVFGERAASTYADLKRLGEVLYSRATSNDVLNQLSAQGLWYAMLQWPLHMKNECSLQELENNSSESVNSQLYDARFLLPCFLQIVSHSYDARFDCHKFVDKNCLAMTIGMLSSYDATIRAMAYAVLHAFLKHHGDPRGDLEEYQRLKAQGIHFDVTHQVFLLKQLRNSIEEENTRLSCVTTHFFARMSKLLMHPEDASYGKLTMYITSEAQLPLRTVHCFKTMFKSDDVANCTQQRQWMLTYCADALRTPEDFMIMESCNVFEEVLQDFHAPWANEKTRMLTMKLLKKALAMEKVCKRLLDAHNVILWLQMAFDERRNSFELRFIVDLVQTMAQSAMRHKVTLNALRSYRKAFTALLKSLHEEVIKSKDPQVQNCKETLKNLLEMNAQ